MKTIWKGIDWLARAVIRLIGKLSPKLGEACLKLWENTELVSYLLRDQESDPQAIWESDIFGRKLADIIKDGMNSKLSMIPETARIRLQGILTKLINRGKGNVIAIVL